MSDEPTSVEPSIEQLQADLKEKSQLLAAVSENLKQATILLREERKLREDLCRDAVSEVLKRFHCLLRVDDKQAIHCVAE